MRFRLLFVPDREVGMLDARLRMRISWGGRRLSFTVGHRVTIDKWSYDSQRCKANTYHGADKIPAGVINADLQEFEDIVKATMAEFTARHEDPSVEDLRSALAPLLGKKKKETENRTLLDHFNEFILEQGVECSWTDGTYTKVRSVRLHLKYWKPGVNYSDMTPEGLSKFCTHLVTDAQLPGVSEKGLRNSTARRNMGIVKWFLNWANKKGYTSDTSYTKYKCKLKVVPPPVIFLSWEELMRVWSHEFPENQQGLARSRDCFCFQCFSSLRYSDLHNLKFSDVDMDGNVITLATIKTNDPIRIDLNKYTRAILEKYLDPGNLRALPVISNQKYNEAIEEICKACKIDSLVTIVYYKGATRYEEVLPKYELVKSHAGRRTFICNSLIMGIPAEVVMKWTGHADYKSMIPYIAVADSERKKAMQAFDNKE